MKACEKCHLHVRHEGEYCPLCGAVLEEGGAPPFSPPENDYPDLSGVMQQYNFVRRLLLFLSLLGCGVSLLINVLVAPGFLWSLIVIAATIYCWLTIPPLLRRGVNYAARIVFLVGLTSLLTVALDGIIGYRGWSVDFVVPGLLSTGILSTALMAVFNRTRWAQYVLYQVLIGVFGFVPLILFLTGVGGNLVMVIVTAALAMASLLLTIVFGDRSIKSEFKRRFDI